MRLANSGGEWIYFFREPEKPKMLKLRKKSSKKGPRKDVSASYRRFCDSSIHGPLFDCCCRVIQVEDANETETDISNEKVSDNKFLDTFSQLSVNDASRGKISKSKRKRKKSGHDRSVSSLEKSLSMTPSPRHKFYSTSDLSTSLAHLPNKAHFLSKMATKRPLMDLHVKDLHVSHQFVNLKSHLAAFSSSIPDLSQKKLEEISDHDKKILSRMALKRSKEIAAIQDAQLAHDYWDKEKVARQKLIAEQNESYFREVKEKRELEVAQTRKRMQKLEMEERAQIERLKQELAEKEAKTETLLKNIEFQKEMRMYQKRQREFQKMDIALVNQQEHEMNDEIWRQILIERLQQRIQRADDLRQRIQDVQKVRIQSDNQLEQTIHAANYDETKKVEKIRLKQLMERIDQRDEKYKQFQQHRSLAIQESKRRAKISAVMRELIKRSISPDNVIKYNGNARSISNLSHCDSHIKLG